MALGGTCFNGSAADHPRQHLIAAAGPNRLHRPNADGLAVDATASAEVHRPLRRPICGLTGEEIRFFTDGYACPIGKFTVKLQTYNRRATNVTVRPPVPTAGGTDAPPAPVPRDDWPLWAKTIARLATPKDRGVNDTIARTIRPVGGDAFENWFLALTGHPCNGDGQPERFNASNFFN